MHILDEDGNELPPGQAGEIYFEGGFDFEYLNDPIRPAKSRDKHGWMTVGDIGYVDEDGYLYLTDRRHHMIISGGVNIYPQEAENMLVTHPKVMDAAVFGIPDDEMGQSVKGVVQTRRSRRRHRANSPTNCWSGCETGWRTTSVRDRSRSRRSCLAPTPASCTSRTW